MTVAAESRVPSGEAFQETASLPVEEPILKRFRELLCAQRDRFRLYLEVLNKQRDVITRGGTEDILVQVEVEEKILADILAIQKVIDPIEVLYRAASVSNDGEARPLTGEILEIKAVLEDLQSDVRIRAEQNKKLLSKRMTLIACEIQAIKGNPLRKRTSVYANSGTPSFIDLEL